MVEEGILELRNNWFPTQAAGERYFAMLLESSVNQPPGEGEPSIAEMAWATSDVERAMSRLPSMVPAETKRRMRQLLQPWSPGRYTEAYERSGGILNLYTPPWGAEQDEVWAAMLAGWEAQSFPDEATREEALRTLEQEWNHTPHPFFAGLTPAQVMVGSGAREAELAEGFVQQITDMFQDRPFESEGQALINVLNLLRSWQSSPRDESRTARDIIVAERDELLRRRLRILQARDEA